MFLRLPIKVSVEIFNFSSSSVGRRGLFQIIQIQEEAKFFFFVEGYIEMSRI